MGVGVDQYIDIKTRRSETYIEFIDGLFNYGRAYEEGPYVEFNGRTRTI